jgi:hypothetical protein
VADPTLPVRERALVGLVTILSGINGNPSYFNDLSSGEKIHRFTKGPQPAEQAIYIKDLGDSDTRDDAILDAYTLVRSKLNFELEIFSGDHEETSPATMNKWLYDIKKVVYVAANRTQSGLVNDTFITGVSQITTDSEVASEFNIFSITGYIDYTYKSADPSSIR